MSASAGEVRVTCTHCDATGKCECRKCKTIKKIDGFFGSRKEFDKTCKVCGGAKYLAVPRDEAEQESCIHCQGTGKCGCADCLTEFDYRLKYEEDLMRNYEQANRKAKCTLCDGRGFHWVARGGTGRSDRTTGGFQDVTG